MKNIGNARKLKSKCQMKKKNMLFIINNGINSLILCFMCCGIAPFVKDYLLVFVFIDEGRGLCFVLHDVGLAPLPPLHTH